MVGMILVLIFDYTALDKTKLMQTFEVSLLNRLLAIKGFDEAKTENLKGFYILSSAMI